MKSFTKGGIGHFYPNVTSFIGICVPSLCKNNDIKELLPFFEDQAESIGYLQATAKIEQNQIKHNSFVSNYGITITTFLVGFLFLLVLFGTVIEYTQIGNRTDICVTLNNFTYKYKDTNRQLLLIKDQWSLFFLAFSFNRNVQLLFLNKKNYKIHKRNVESIKGRQLFEKLAALDGIRAISQFFILISITIWLAQYQVILNFQEMPELTHSFTFIFIISCGYIGSEIFLFASGILQTISFVQKYSYKPQFLDIFKFIFRRLSQIIPLYYFYCGFSMYILPMLGDGPFWYLFNQFLTPCEESWWTNFIFINNIYPNFGQINSICLPWTWYISLYIQLSIVLPFFLYFLYKVPIFTILIQITICLTCMTFTGCFIALNDIDISLFFQSYFYLITDKPWGQFVIFGGLGCLGGYLFNSALYRKINLDPSRESHYNSLGYSFLRIIKKKLLVRLFVVFLGISIIFGVTYLHYLAFISDDDWNIAWKVVFGTLKSIICMIGVALIILPVLMNKLRILQCFLSFRIWTIMSHLSLGIYLWYPVIILCQFYSMDQMITITYFQMFYFAIPSFFYTIFISFICYVLIQAPILQLQQIFNDAELIRNGKKQLNFKIYRIHDKIL